MGQHHELLHEADAAYRAGRVREAALLYRRAGAAARSVGDRAAWFRSWVWAGHSIELAGDLQAALGLYLEARMAEPDDARPYDRWIVRKRYFSVLRHTRPSLRALEESLADLRAYAGQHPVPAAGLVSMEQDLAAWRGDWPRALELAERAWSLHDGGQGLLKGGLGLAAARHCLRLGRVDAARAWLSAARELDPRDASVAVDAACVDVLLALAQAEAHAELRARLRRYIDRALPLQRDEIADQIRETTVRVDLLDPHAGDPADPLHPSHAELRRPPRNRQSVHGRYNAHLLHLDYRLACLRHAAGLAPVDDLYYAAPQQPPLTPPPVDAAELRLRLRRARASARHALRYARHLDGLLECDYRQREVEARLRRIDELVNLVGPTLAVRGRQL